MTPHALRDRVQARDRLVAQAEQLGRQMHAELLSALHHGDLPRATATAQRNDAELRALAENLRIYQAELRAQAEELAESQARSERALTRFASLFAGLPLPALLVGDSGEVLEHNAAADRLFGLGERAAAARFLHRLVEPAPYQERVAPALHEARAVGASRVDDVACIGAAAQRFVGEMHLARLPGVERGSGQFAVVIVDRSASLAALQALRQAGDALARSEAMLADAARVARTGGWALQLRPRRWHWSSELWALLGDTAAPAAGRAAAPSLELLLARCAVHDRGLLAAAFAAAEGGQPFDLEVDLLTAAGTPWRARVIGHAETEDGVVARLAGVVQDISSQHRAHRRIEDLGERLSMANEAGGIGVFDWQPDRGLLVVDARLRQLFGLSKSGGDDRGATMGAETATETATGARTSRGGAPDADAESTWTAATPAELSALLAGRVEADGAALLEAGLARTLAVGEPTHLELLSAGPPARWLHLTARAHVDAGGRVSRIVGCAWDSSPEHEAARLRATQEASELASRAKSAFLSRMSHELRTPLNAILGFSQLMRMEAEGGDLVLKPHRVALIETAARHLLDLVDEVLQVTRVDGGAGEVHLARFDLVDLVHEALPLVQGLADRSGIRLYDTLAGGPPRWVLGDRLRLKEVLIHLLTNAVKYNRPQGSVEVNAFDDGERVVLEVLDTGRGLDAAQQARLFQPFDRAGAEGSGVEGSGMGLFVSRRFVELMGGEIELKSAVGIGTTVRLRLNAPPL